MPAASSPAWCTLVMPTLEPMLAGFVKQGNPICCSIQALNSSGSRSQSLRMTSSQGACGNPTWARIVFAAALSMATEEPSTPAPT
jgi:hypothetical protein